MKVTHRIPTTQYGFVEVMYDHDQDSEQVREHHDKLLAAFAEKPANTMPDKNFTDFLVKMLKGEQFTADEWEAMNPAQQRFCKLLDNAKKRK